jgi:DNA-directed RNA polymerase specialized sigma24 family protein
MSQNTSFQLRVLPQRVVVALVKSLQIPVATAEDLAADAFARLWAKNPMVKLNVAALLYAQSVNLHRSSRRNAQQKSKNVGQFVAEQLNEMLRQDPREDAKEREDILSRTDTAIADAKRTKSALENAFLDVLLTDADAIGVKTRWHVKVGQVLSALTARGFDVSRRDVDNIRNCSPG